MKREAKTLLDLMHQCPRSRLGLCACRFLQKSQNLGRELASAFGSALLRQESLDPVGAEGSLGLIKGGPRESESLGGLSNGYALHLDTTDHLVLDLEQVARVEESAAVSE